MNAAIGQRPAHCIDNASCSEQSLVRPFLPVYWSVPFTEVISAHICAATEWWHQKRMPRKAAGAPKRAKQGGDKRPPPSMDDIESAKKALIAAFTERAETEHAMYLSKIAAMQHNTAENREAANKRSMEYDCSADTVSLAQRNFEKIWDDYIQEMPSDLVSAYYKAEKDDSVASWKERGGIV